MIQRLLMTRQFFRHAFADFPLFGGIRVCEFDGMLLLD